MNKAGVNKARMSRKARLTEARTPEPGVRKTASWMSGRKTHHANVIADLSSL
jgi:hypothetical protein